MFEQLGTVLSVVSTVLLVVLIVFLYKLKVQVPEIIQEALNEVGTQISEVFAKPVVKASMSNLGMKSGEARASKALKGKVADKILGQNVIISKACDYLGISSMEGLQLLNDPTMGPMIQGLIQKFGSAAQGALGGINDGGGGVSQFKGYGREE